MLAIPRLRAQFLVLARAAAVAAAGMLTLGWPAAAQQPAPASPGAPAQAAPAASATTPSPAAESEPSGGITEEELKQLLAGKMFYLRGGYLDNSLSFNEHGGLSGHSPQGSYTLNLIQIERVRLTKHKVELEGIRYGLHFLGALPYEDPTKAVDRVRITPKKKVVRITIDRELVVKPKKEREKHHPPQRSAQPAQNAAAPSVATTSAPSGQPAVAPESTDAEELKAEIAAAPEAERPAEPGSVTTTTSPEHATKVLRTALDNIFSSGLDARMMAAMPDFWKLYYQAAAAKADFRPSDPSVLRQSSVDRKAHLLTNFEPESNQYAQDAGVAGMALYHAVIGADGKPVPVLLDLVVEFRIYSKRTAAVSTMPPEQAGKPPAPSLPGPYSVPHPR